MQITSILSPGRTLCDVPGSSKKRVLENISKLICDDISFLNPNELFDNLVARERLGSTGLGKGIAIPHCRIKHCNSVIGTLIKLAEPIDFDAIDASPVDILFVLLVPEEAHDEHLNTLAQLAEMFSDSTFCQQLRNSNNSEALFTLASSRN